MGWFFGKSSRLRHTAPLGFAFLILSFRFLGGRGFGRGSAPGAILEFAADHMEVVGEDAVSGVALITGESDIETAIF